MTWGEQNSEREAAEQLALGVAAEHLLHGSHVAGRGKPDAVAESETGSEAEGGAVRHDVVLAVTSTRRGRVGKGRRV